ncbi:MAG: ABC transporter permease subunit [Planctomycetota bacterium]
MTRIPFILALLFFGAFVGLPLLAMLFDSVNTPSGIGFAAYSSIFGDPILREEFVNSLELGVAATTIAWVFGFGHAFLTCRTDLPGARWLGPMGLAPLVIPPILVAMGFADFAKVSGFWGCSFLLGVSFAPFVAVLSARGLRAIDGRLFEAGLLARGRGAAERLLARMVLPEMLAGCLFAFIFTISEHGVPEFLTVKGKTWHTYAEGVFSLWTRRATGVEHQDLVSPTVASIPLVLLIVVALFFAMRLRARTSLRGEFHPLPIRGLGRWRWPALLLPLVYLGAGVGVPVVVMARWAAGSTVVNEPMSIGVVRESFRAAWTEAGSDLTYTLGIALVTTLTLLVVAIPLARRAARGRPVFDLLSVVPLAVPAILLGIGMVHVYNHPLLARAYDAVGDFYDSFGIVAAAYAARFLPFGVLTLSSAVRRIPRSLEEAAALSGRRPLAQAVRIHLPMMLPAIWSAACLVFILALRELDLAVVLPAGNGTVVRRLSNVVHFGGENMGGALALCLLLAALLVPLLTILVTGRKLRSLS